MVQEHWETFEGEVVSLDTIDHQHISNCYWFLTIIHNAKAHELSNLLLKIKTKFNSVILPYRPHIRFKKEIECLSKLGCLKPVDYNLVEIWYNGNKVGEIQKDQEKLQ